MPDRLDTHYTTVIKAITDGRVVPFLGAGVNLCDRPAKRAWQPSQSKYLPSGSELASYLAKNFGYPSSETPDLARVSQYVALMTGTGPLYEELHSLFDADYPPTPLHRFFVTLPAVLRDKGYPHPYQLIMTTNYDDVLERAFQAAGEPFDLVCYVAEGKRRGKFVHRPPGGEVRLIEKPKEYHDLPFEVHGTKVNVKRPVILKIHGAVDRTDTEQDSFVITEDHYIDYLTRTNISNLLPKTLAAKLRRSHFLFLGYGLCDWNLRVILQRIWGEQKLIYTSWAIQLKPQELDKKFWIKRDVEILEVCLEKYITTLSKRVQALPHAGGAS